MKDWLVSRILEPSTWGGLGAFCAGLATQIPASWQPYDIGAVAFCAAVAVVVRERGSKSPEEIAADVLAAVKASRPGVPS